MQNSSFDKQVIPNNRKGVAAFLQDSYRELLEEAERFFDSFDFLSSLASQVRDLKAGIGKPFSFALFGRMKAGKSSIVNAILGKDLAVTGVNEATATINVISPASTPDQCKMFEVHLKDGTIERFPIERLREDWTGKSDELNARAEKAAYIQLFSDAPSLSVNEIIDTPGTGATVSDHEKVAQAFIDSSFQGGRKADSLVYVFGINGKKSDEEDLKTFCEGSLAQTFPFNIVGVLHKWDQLFWDEGGEWSKIEEKRMRLKDQLGDLAIDIIPVSAPLAWFASCVSDKLISKVLDKMISLGKVKAEQLLQDCDDWDKVKQRRDLRKQFGEHLPWMCFRVIVREAIRLEEEAIRLGEHATPAQLRKRIRELGGVDKLNSFLDKNFYKDSALIRLQNQYGQCRNIIREAQYRISERLDALERDIGFWQILHNNPPGELASWIEEKRRKAMSARDALKRAAETFDISYQNSTVQDVLSDIEALTWCRNNYEIISEADVDELRVLADRLVGDDSKVPDMTRLREIERSISLQIGIVGPNGRQRLEHLKDRVNLYLASQERMK